MKRFLIAAALVCCGLFRTWSQVALSVGSPAIPPSSPVFVIGSPAIAAPIATGGATTTPNVSLQTLSDVLTMLQTNLEQTLPVVSSFNDNFDFISLSDNGLAAQGSSGNFGVNTATNLAVNLGVNAAMPTGPGLFNAAPNRATLNLGAPASPQGLSAVPFTRDTLRALLILQSDIEHMLTVVNILNSGTTNAGSFTNLFGVAQ
jgi:hypothetical protein